jgi:hypothetical protein
MKLINVTPLLLTLAGSAAAQVTSCADYILVVARGSGEPGGSTVITEHRSFSVQICTDTYLGYADWRPLMHRIKEDRRLQSQL